MLRAGVTPPRLAVVLLTLAEAGRHHREDPVVTFALIDGRAGNPLGVEHRIRRIAEFTIDAREIMFAVEILDAHGRLCGEAMMRLEHDLELLAIERLVVQPL